MTRQASLTRRLAIWSALSTLGLVLIAGGVLYVGLARILERELEHFVADRVLIVVKILSERPTDISLLKHEVEWEWTNSPRTDLYLRVLNERGDVLTETLGTEEKLDPSSFPEPFPLDGEWPDAKLHTEKGAMLSLFAVRFVAQGRMFVIQAAADHAPYEQLLTQYRRLFLFVTLAAGLVCAFLGFAIARQGLTPLRRMDAVLGAIRSESLEQRIEAGVFPLELSRLAETFNRMLDRLRDSFARLSRFSADIAHELRTPIQNLRGEIEVTLAQARSAEEYRETLTSSLEECDRLSRLIDSLLFLARAEHPGTLVRAEPVDVSVELDRVVAFYEAQADEHGVRLSVDCPAALRAVVDRILLQRAVGNLVENAILYTPKGGSVVVSARTEDGSLRVSVADTGNGIPREQLPLIFDRLYRGNSSRTANGAGSGLGLSIVKTIAELHGGRVDAESEVARGTRMTVILPEDPTRA